MSSKPQDAWASYCKDHNRFHHPDEPCYECENVQLKARVEELENQVFRLEHVIPITKEN